MRSGKNFNVGLFVYFGLDVVDAALKTLELYGSNI